jgi:hypothetical protein
MCTPINGVPNIDDYVKPFGLRLKPDTPLAAKGKHLYLDDSHCKPKTGGEKCCTWLKYGNKGKALSVYFTDRSIRLEDDVLRGFYVEKHKVKFEANVFVFHDMRCPKLAWSFNGDGSVSPLLYPWFALGVKDSNQIDDKSKVCLVYTHDMERKICFSLPKDTPRRWVAE